MNVFRSPHAMAKNHGASGTGSGAFLWERLTSLVLIPLGLILFVQLMARVGSGFDLVTVRAWLGFPVNGALFITFYVLAMVNGYLCGRKMLEDYLHQPLLKLAALLGLSLATWVMGTAVVVSVFIIMFRV